MASPALSEPIPQPVRGLGTTWVARRAPYWFRRAWLLVVRLFLVLLMGIFAAGGVGFVNSYRIATAWREEIYVGMAACFAYGFGTGVRAVVKVTHAAKTSDPGTGSHPRRPFYLRTSIGRRLFGFVVFLLIPASGPLALGYALGYLPAVSLGRELPEERRARLDLERQRREMAEERARLAARHPGPIQDS